jgi:hypothetical protein
MSYLIILITFIKVEYNGINWAIILRTEIEYN